ncbi:unnamed protein product [Symbiodinium necroappetens]|uniref:Uncharacterized protein n=1 Tax=Symbiodinium necroappetens TaxID=1628268 RepID=A0A812TVX6_9DINO|nr:unnamed protein product [Symbiodinium necroappetens]
MEMGGLRTDACRMIENQIMLQKRISLSWWRSLLSKSVRAWQPMAQAFREELERRLSRTSKSEDLKQNLVEAPVPEVSAEASAEAEVPAEVPRVSSAALSLSFSARETEVEALAPRSLLSPIAGSGSSSSSSPRTFVSQGSRGRAPSDVVRAESTGLLGLGGSRSTWGRRLLEADVRSLRAELQEERARSSRLAAELRHAQAKVEKLQGQLDLQRERDELLQDLDSSLREMKTSHTSEQKEAMKETKAQEKQEKKALMAELAKIEKMRAEREKDRLHKLKQAKGKSKGKRSAAEAGLPTKEPEIRDID